jgi:spermidine synthase
MRAAYNKHAGPWPSVTENGHLIRHAIESGYQAHIYHFPPRTEDMAKKRRNRGARRAVVQVAPRAGGGLALEVNGVVQSVTVGERGPEDAGYWGLMISPERPARALLLGLGGGTVAALLARVYPGCAIVGIEREAAALAVARLEMGLDEIPGLQVVEADAFAWVAEHARSEPGAYDYIALDLYEGGRLVAGTLGALFLREIATLLAPEGWLAVNLTTTMRLPEQIQRLEGIFTLAETRRLWGNVVLLLRHLRETPLSADE